MRKTNRETRPTFGSENLALASREIRFPCFGQPLSSILASGERLSRPEGCWGAAGMALRVTLVLCPLSAPIPYPGGSSETGERDRRGLTGQKGWGGDKGSTPPRTSAAAPVGWWPHGSWNPPFLSSSAKRPQLEEPSPAPTLASRRSQQHPCKVATNGMEWELKEIVTGHLGHLSDPGITSLPSSSVATPAVPCQRHARDVWVCTCIPPPPPWPLPKHQHSACKY